MIPCCTKTPVFVAFSFFEAESVVPCSPAAVSDQKWAGPSCRAKSTPADSVPAEPR
ncbi:MAG: hypothetical protein V9E87_11570 [Gemmatimonadales bacterium]